MALLEAGTAAPEIQGENLTGGPVKLADYAGKRAVALVFPPVNVDPASVSSTNALYQDVRDDIEIIAVYKKFPSKQMAKMFLKQMGVQFPVLLDESGAAYEAYGVEKPPAAYYIDKEGNIVAASAIGDLGEIADDIKAELL
ncbi:MAG: Thiol-disulfide oxidoreductase ResA [Anaerolineales bacterium]|nr:Thiol-disulfide oxidoreductase ResA [Anaerolineales bacterium]